MIKFCPPPSSSLSSFLSPTNYRFMLIAFINVELLVVGLQSFADGAADNNNYNRIMGPPINVTKQLFFRDFSSNNLAIGTDHGRNDDLKLLGSAIVSYSKNCLQIPDIASQEDEYAAAGRVLYPSPIRLFDPLSRTPASFQTSFSFQFESTSQPSVNSTIQASNITTDSSIFAASSSGGHGLTFIIVPDEFTVGRPGPWMGMLNDACDRDYKAVAVEFDTHHNPEFSDPNDNHVGINLGTIVSTATFNASDAGVYFKDGSVYRAWIVYDGLRRFMDIRLGQDGEEYPSKPAFSVPVDLSPFLNEYMFVGFSASSSGNRTRSQIHNVFSWNFTSISQAILRVPAGETCEDHILVQRTGDDEKNPRTRMPVSFLIFIAVVVLLLITFINLCYSGKARNHKSGPVTVIPDSNYQLSPPNKPRRFTIAEISSATRGFSEFQKLGSDLRGMTYKAKMSNGCNTVVKRFSAEFFDSHGLNRRRVAKGIKAMSRIRHTNLVPIRGWCFDDEETTVVYDWLSNGSLDKWIYGVGVLPWTRRFKVVKDVAESLSFLHSKQLAHKNMKTSSVFLDVSFRAVVGDFGFVMCSAESQRFESAVSLTADVFEFGVFALEVVAGRSRKPDSELDDSGRDLLDLTWDMHERDEKLKLVDRRMGSAVNFEQMLRVLDVGLLCTLNENRGRPTMEGVVNLLSLEVQLPELPPSRPVAMFPYNSATGLCNAYPCTSLTLRGQVSMT